MDHICPGRTNCLPMLPGICSKPKIGEAAERTPGFRRTFQFMESYSRMLPARHPDRYAAPRTTDRHTVERKRPEQRNFRDREKMKSCSLPGLYPKNLAGSSKNKNLQNLLTLFFLLSAEEKTGAASRSPRNSVKGKIRRPLPARLAGNKTGCGARKTTVPR